MQLKPLLVLGTLARPIKYTAMGTSRPDNACEEFIHTKEWV